MYLGHRRHILAWCKLSLHRSFSWTVHILFLYNHKCAWWWHSATLEMPLRLKNWEECRIPYWSVLYTSFLWFHITNIYRQLVKDCETQFWYILIREWSYAGISHDQSTPGDFFPSPQHPKEWRLWTINVEQFLPQINQGSTWISGWYYRKSLSPSLFQRINGLFCLAITWTCGSPWVMKFSEVHVGPTALHLTSFGLHGPSWNEQSGYE